VQTSIKSRALKEFAEATATLANPAVQEWRKQGGKVVGYCCSYFPEEIVTAAGFLSFRMRATGSKGTELADAYLSSINCSFARHCFNLGLRGEYDFVDGAVWLSTCDHVRRIYDNWKRKVNTPFVHIMSLPKKIDEPQVGWYRDEMVNLKEALERHFSVKITDERLWEAIRLHNETRRLQRQLYELRKRGNPPITGAEALAVMVAGTAMPKQKYNQLLRELLDEISQREGNADYRARLMILGGILDDPGYIKVIEEQGGLVVTDMLCFGTKIMWKDVAEGTGDPLAALARYYIAERPSCARMFGDYPRRVDFVRDMVREFKVDGIIGERLIFCDLWALEHYMLAKEFKTEGVPYLVLDREYLLGGIGQLRTRVQAFLETIRR
jgi:benzoyl-CoA reductase subunit C